MRPEGGATGHEGCSVTCSIPYSRASIRRALARARGHAALTAVYTGQGGGPLKLRALAFAESGDVGYIIGAYGYGDAPADMGKFTLTLRKGAGGRWLIASDMDNGNRAPRP